MVGKIELLKRDLIFPFVLKPPSATFVPQCESARKYCLSKTRHASCSRSKANKTGKSENGKAKKKQLKKLEEK